MANLALLDHLGIPSKSCPKCFVKIQLDLPEILPFVKCIKNTVILGGHWWFLTGVLEGLVIFGIKFDIMNDHHMSLLSCRLIFITYHDYKCINNTVILRGH